MRLNLCSILKVVYFDSWSWQSFVSTCSVFNCLFPLDVQNEIQLLSRVFCLIFMDGLFIEFLVEKCAACRKSDFGWHRFCFSPCWMRKSIIKAQAILALLDSFQELHLEIWKAWVIIVFISNFMKSSGAVYEASLCTFVLRFDWDTDLTSYEVWYKLKLTEL